MKTTRFSFILAAALASTVNADAGSSKTYQVTGPVLEVSDSVIAVQKGKDRWEIVRDSTTKADGDVKPGDKVTVTYTMTATKIETKGTGKTDAKPSATASPTKK